MDLVGSRRYEREKERTCSRSKRKPFPRDQMDLSTILIVFTGLVVTFSNAVDLPDLPDQWTATIEANIANRNYTVHFKEWHDATGDRGRVDFYSRREGSSTSSIYDFESTTFIHTNTSGCYHGSTDHLGRNFIATTGSDGRLHLMSTSSFLALAENETHVYNGISSVRGIDCDIWTTTFECANSRDPLHPCDLNYTLTWAFAIAGWAFPESDDRRIPVRINLAGRRTSRFDFRTNEPLAVPYTYDILHLYDFVAFHVGTPADEHFDRPCGMECQSINSTWSSTTLSSTPCPVIPSSSSSWTDGQVGGLAFGMTCVGVIVALIGVYVTSLLTKSSSVGGQTDDGLNLVDPSSD